MVDDKELDQYGDRIKQQWHNTLNILEECTDDYIFIFDMMKDHFTISKNALDVYSLPAESFYNASEILWGLVHSEDRKMLSDDLEEIRNGIKDTHNLEYRWMDKCNNVTWISCRGKVVDNDNKLFVGRISRLDVRRKADQLTGFLAESQLKINYVARMAKEPDFSGFFLMIGVDNLKRINEKFGMAGGDKVITIVSEAIRNIVKDKVNIYRMTGDEFVICLPDNAYVAKNVYNQIRSYID